MIKSETIAQLEALRNYLRTEEAYGAKDNDIAALNTVIEAARGGKVYTAFDVIRMVQAVVSDAVRGFGMGEEESTVTAYEIERDIVSKLVQEDANDD